MKAFRSYDVASDPVLKRLKRMAKSPSKRALKHLKVRKLYGVERPDALTLQAMARVLGYNLKTKKRK